VVCQVGERTVTSMRNLWLTMAAMFIAIVAAFALPTAFILL
jgi:hypothetical protein